MPNANGLDPGLRSNYGTYVTFDPTGKTQSVPYGSPGTPGGVGWIAPEAVKGSGNYWSNSNSFIDSGYYNRFPSGGNLGSGKPEDNPLGITPKKAFNAIDPIGTSPDDTRTVNNNTATPGALSSLSSNRSLTNRKPTLGTAWGGWSNNMQTNSTPGSNNFTFYSKFA